MIIKGKNGVEFSVEGIVTISFPEYKKVENFEVTAHSGLIADMLSSYLEKNFTAIGSIIIPTHSDKQH